MRNFSNQSIESLYALLHDIVLDAAADIQKAAEILQELRSRGEAHPYMRFGTLSKFREIANGELSAKAAIVFGDNNALLNRLIGLPLEQQDEIATTGIIPVVELDKDEKPVEVQKPILSASKETLERVFGKGEIRSAVEQEKLILQQTSAKVVTAGRQVVVREHLRSVGRVTINIKKKRLVLTAGSYKVEELIEPLRLLGYTLTPIKDDALV